MGAVTRSTTSHTRRARRVLVLLVMAVVAGVLAMHALPPGGAPTAHDDAGHAVATAQPTAVHQASEGCSHTDGGAGHLDHADRTCAAAGIGSPYAPPALTAALEAALPTAAPNRAHTTTASGRAPPDLSELQLLRI